MTQAAFFFYPDVEGAVLRALAPSGATSIEPEPIVDGEDIVTMDGTRRRYVRSNGTRVKVTMTWSGLTEVGQRFTRQMLTLEEHLRRGGWCGFAGDYSKAWASWVGYRGEGSAYGTVGVARGATVLPTVGNAFGAWASAATMTTGDEAVLEEIQPPSLRSQVSRVSSLSSAALTLATATGEPGAIRDYAAPVFARHRDFYPLLRLVDGSLASSQGRIAYTMDATFEADYAGLAAFGAAFGLGAVPLTGDTVAPSTAALERLLSPADDGSAVGSATGLGTVVRRTDFPPLAGGIYRPGSLVDRSAGGGLRRWF